MFHREIESFKSVLSAVMTYFNTLPQSRRLPRERQLVQSMKNHIKLCEETAHELLQKLPGAQEEDRGILAQAFTQFKQLPKMDAISKLRNDMVSLKGTLELWLQIFQLYAVE